ncbi:hypothetical protein [Bacillus licheniformis]|uniref:hypothetical protein n=1 Tax=Bacillus licheniformis TaxID=1402 RepID=UPI002281F42B|nr:hypothetical protein [Bacillus licheniformis]MCY9266441.1 hypothetical protein [Bacillus licheniformis]MEC0794190.1 hypothetical protein [Bacillus licheniformis]
MSLEFALHVLISKKNELVEIINDMEMLDDDGVEIDEKSLMEDKQNLRSLEKAIAILSGREGEML